MLKQRINWYRRFSAQYPKETAKVPPVGRFEAEPPKGTKAAFWTRIKVRQQPRPFYVGVPSGGEGGSDKLDGYQFEMSQSYMYF